MFYDLVGSTGSGLAHANWKPFGDGVPGARRASLWPNPSSASAN
jgi:hypothetical protein